MLGRKRNKKNNSVYSFSNIQDYYQLSSNSDNEKISNFSKSVISGGQKLAPKFHLNKEFVTNSFAESQREANEYIHMADVKRERKVLVIYTSGSCGMQHTESDFFRYRENFLFEFLKDHVKFCDKNYTVENLNPEFNPMKFLSTPKTFFKQRIYYKIKEFGKIDYSCNMEVELWRKLAKKIKKNYEKFDAFVILHGSDTMTYTASTLSFMLENLGKPVILTGGQIPIVEMRNDTEKNLIDSLTIAGFYNIPEVAIMFGSNLYRGNRTILNDIVNLNSFDSPNMRPLVGVGIQIEVNWDLIMKEPENPFTVFDDLNDRICIVRMFNTLTDSIFESFFREPIQGVIIETYGAGNIPLNRPKLIEIMKEASERGVIIVNVSQCRKGLVSTTYETGSILEKIGVIFCGDMTVECAMAKLAYLLGKESDKSLIRKLLKQNLRGEITEPNKEFFSLQTNTFLNSLLHVADLKEESTELHLLTHSLVPTIICDMIEKENLELIKKFENEIRHIHFTEYSTKCPLHIAAKNGNEEIVRYLLRFHNIKINMLDNKNHTALFYACYYMNETVAMMLKDNGGIINEEPYLGSVLCRFAWEGKLEHIKLFYHCGVNLLVKDYDSRTLAHIAAAEGKVDIIKFLVDETNFTLIITDRWGKTPIDDCSEEIEGLLGDRIRDFTDDMKGASNRTENNNIEKSNQENSIPSNKTVRSDSEK